MSEYPPTSVLLPTVRRTDAVDEVAAQLGPDDELLVICDAEDDPVARGAEDLPDGARLVVAGEPEGCSGKANAIAAGTEAAEHDRLVWTDDDFHHPPDWLATLQADYERHGPTSELPFFRGEDPLSVLFEPLYFLTGSVSIYLLDVAWGGGVIFERDDLDADRADRPRADASAQPGQTDDEAAFLRDLRRTISDDGLLGEYLDLTTLRRTHDVDVGGGVRAWLERHVRWTRIVRVHGEDSSTAVVALIVLLALGVVLQPLLGAVALAVLTGLTYAAFGVRRWTFLLAAPALVASLPLGLYERSRDTFVWGGRRYRWRSKFDVEVVDED